MSFSLKASTLAHIPRPRPPSASQWRRPSRAAKAKTPAASEGRAASGIARRLKALGRSLPSRRLTRSSTHSGNCRQDGINLAG